MTEPTPPPSLVPVDEPSKPDQATLLEAARTRYQTLAALLARGRGPDGGGGGTGGVTGEGTVSDPDLVHDLRVGSRRLGEVARLLGEFLDKPTAKAVAASIRSLRRAMGDLRDLDVTRQHLLKWRIPGPLRHIAAEIAASLEGGRPALQTAAQTQMDSASLTGSMVILARVLEDRAAPERAAESQQRLEEGLRELVKDREKSLRRSFGHSAQKQTAASLHAARIEVKKLRYLLELAADAGTIRGARKKIVFLKRLQQLLGDHHDTHVIAEQLAAHLKDRRPTPIKGLAPAWREWQRQVARLQAKRAADYFARTYAWING